MTFRSSSPFDARTTLLAVVPEVRRRADGADAVQRPLFRVGQSLTKALLTLDARNAEARLGRLGWFLADGVIDGFRITLEDQATRPGRFIIESGSAIASNGQDLSTGRGQSVDLTALPRSLSTGEDGGGMRGVNLLMLEPVAGYEARPEQSLGGGAGFAWDQQRDPSAVPYVDARVIDGFALSVIKLKSTVGLVTDANGINRAAHMVIDARTTDTPLGAMLRRNIAIAMMGVEDDGTIRWVARHGAAERGGGLVQGAVRARVGTGRMPRQFRAAVDSLMEQMVDWQTRNPGVPFPANRLRRLPAAGIVPARGGVLPQIFPETYDQVVAPLPESEMAAVLRDAQALAAYDLDTARDEVAWHLPVPDALYEPRLLEEPKLAKVFNDAVLFFQQKVAAERARRSRLRNQVDRVQARIDTDMVTDFGADDDALEGEGDFPVVEVIEVPRYDLKSDDLFSAWRAAVPETLVTARQLGQLLPDNSGERRGVVPFQIALMDALKPANDFVDFGFTRVQADIYRLRQSMLDNEESTKLATFPILAGIAKGSNALATNRSLKDYFAATVEKRAELARAVDPAQPVLALRGATAVSDGGTLDLIRAGVDASAGGGLFFGGGGGGASRGLAAAVVAGAPRETTGAALYGSTSTRALDTAGIVELAGGTKVEIGLGTRAAAGVVVTGAKTATPGSFTTTFLADAYQADNIYGQLFEQDRKAATEEYALQTVSDLQAGIKYANAMPGSFEDLRTVTIADRLANPAANAARTSALRIKADAFSQIQSLDISLTDLRAPVIALTSQVVVATAEQVAALKADGGLEAPVRDALDKGTTPVEADASRDLVIVDFAVVAEALGSTDMPPQFLKFREAAVQAHTPLGIRQLAIYALQGALDPKDPEAQDESSYLTSAVSILESVVVAYRATEGRIAAIQGLVEKTRLLIAALREIEIAWKRELGVVERDLAEARHDLRVALSLRAEEVARVAALARHRADVIAKHVRVAVFARPRRLRPHAAGLTSSRLLPGVYEDPLPDVLRTRADLPPELRKMINILREVPVGWFAGLQRFLPFLAKPQLLDLAFHHSANAATVALNVAQTQTLTSVVTGVEQPLSASRPQAGRRDALARTLDQVDRFYGGLQQRMRDDRRTIDLAKLVSTPWQEKQRVAIDRLSLADLSGAAQDTELSKEVTAQTERIERVVSALLATLRQAPAAVRLLWAEKLSAFDENVRVRDATRLPGWTALDIGLRRDILRYVDWLNRQMSAKVVEAQTLMADIVQVTILLSAHSDVSEIVSARLNVAQDVSGGDIVDVVIDRGTPAIGTRVDFGLGKSPTPVWGVISDLKAGHAKVRLDARFTERVSLSRTTQVFFNTVQVRQDVRHVR